MKEKLISPIELYTDAVTLARVNSQVVGEKNEFYVTLMQLEELIKKIADSNPSPSG